MSNSIIDVPLFKELCAIQMRLDNSSEDNIALILNFLLDKGIMTREDCNNYETYIKQCLTEGLEKVDKDIIKEVDDRVYSGIY